MGASELIIRTATPEEYAAVGELTVDVYVGEGYVHPDSPYVAELAGTERRAAAAQVLVAVHDDRVIGSLTVARYGTPYAEIARPGELEFRMLAVAKRARGLGAGTALVRTVIEMATKESCEAVALTTMSAMADARRIYDRFGFVAVPERDWTTQAGELLTVLRLPLIAH
ncbi:putative N-acyltransferase, GNAT family [Nocardia amikacinitolerans]|uniref:GNAT family N-acetyltransferase n=1 Tax=Nocardia amikacinitolerans TaxID=756689 RepID=UPI00083087FE|nr:GNAT family N-acetyltransferase [Nocardia amikacinitolerans]MCP2317105.1 putative N-acyltransferase, GNAT family [Nocardia amikacinitolerans]